MGVMRHSLAAGFAVVLSMTAASASNISIALQQAGTNGGAVTTVAGPTAGTATFTGSYGTFSDLTVTGSSLLALPNLLFSNTINTSTAVAGTLTILVTAQGITTPTGLQQFISGFTTNLLPAGWSVQESTFISVTNQLYTGAGLSLFNFTSTGTNSQTAAFPAGAGPYSVTERFEITATGLGSSNSTINLQAVPGPIVGAGLPGLLAACGALLAFARRRRHLAA